MKRNVVAGFNIVVVGVCCLAFGTQLWANGDGGIDCESECNWESWEGLHKYRVVVDSNTGNIIDGSTEFPDGVRIQVVFVNKNPFKYRYRFDITSKPIEQDVIATSLATIGLGLVSEAVGTLSPVDPGSVDKGAGTSACDSKVDTAIEAVVSMATELTGTETRLNNRLTELVGISQSHDEFLKGIQTNRWEGSCRVRCESAIGLVGKLEKFGRAEEKNLNDLILELRNQMSALSQSVDALKDLKGEVDITAGEDAAGLGKLKKTLDPDKPEDRQIIGAVDEKIGAINDRASDCRDKIETIVREGRDLAETIVEHLDKYETTVEDIEGAKEPISAMLEIIRRVQALDQPFFEVRYPATLSTATLVEIVIIRRNQLVEGAEEERVPVVPIQIGRSRFSFSAGLGVTLQDLQTVARQTGYYEDETGASHLGTVFGYEEDSSMQAVLATQLNARLWTLNTSANRIFFGWSLGAAFGLDGEGGLGFYTGPSVSFLDDQLFFTFAYHLQKVETLSGGFEVGQVVPEGLVDPIPTTKETKGALMFGVTYRIR